MNKEKAPKAQGHDHGNGNGKASKYKPKPLPKGVKDDHRDAHLILNDWAAFLFAFNKGVYKELHAMEKEIDDLKKHIAKLQNAGPVLPTAGTTHIPDPPPPPYT